MPTLFNRRIVRIDEEKCNGCGQCVPSCAEGAIQVVGGKARLVSDKYCDGLGACLGTCPVGAITVEERAAEAFDQEAVEAMLRRKSITKPQGPVPIPVLGHGLSPTGPAPTPGSLRALVPEAGLHPQGVGCPGARFRDLIGPGRAGAPSPSGPPSAAGSAAASGESASAGASHAAASSRLAHWPVQLALVPPAGRIWQDADVLIAADCVPFAMPDFHESLLKGKSLAIACPKLDDVEPYVEKLAYIFANNSVRSVAVAHMEVPCCSGILYAVRAAMEKAGRTDIPMEDVTIGVDGRRL